MTRCLLLSCTILASALAAPPAAAQTVDFEGTGQNVNR